MPSVRIGDADIYYETYGSGYPLLLFAPGGLRSHIEMWTHTNEGALRTWVNPIELFTPEYQVVVMDQRNAGKSHAPFRPTDGWHSYAEDHLGLMDHLGHDRFHVLGSCIGSSFSLKLCEMAPERISAAVLQQPIGLTEANREWRAESFEEWAEEVHAKDPSVPDSALEGLRSNMYDHDFVFCVSRDFVRKNPIPLLVLAGHDLVHPTSIAEEIVELAPNARLVLDWKEPKYHDTYVNEVSAFLRKATPAA
jgi:pimeloyl-ACP methyl ester carboxylesterase